MHPGKTINVFMEKQNANQNKKVRTGYHVSGYDSVHWYPSEMICNERKTIDVSEVMTLETVGFHQ
jgi:hypothetical protein